MKDRIIKIMEEKNLTQAEFADAIGVGRPNITHLMTGRYTFSQVIASNTLLTFPEINPMWLLKGDGNMYKTTNKQSLETKSENDLITKTMDNEIGYSDTVDEKSNVDEDQIYNTPSIEPSKLNIPQEVQPEPGILHSEGHEPQTQQSDNLPSSHAKNKIEKIVFFYSDQTFEEYYPKG